MRTVTPILASILLISATAFLVSQCASNPKTDTNEILPGHSLVNAAAKGKSAVVFIYNLSTDTSTVYGESQTGSGVIISEDGYILTNQHVVHGAHSIHIYTDDRKEYTAILIGADTSKDVALLKIEANAMPYLEFGNSDEVLIGEQVLAIGNPLRLQSTVTSGIISAKERTIKLGNNTTPYYLQTDVPLNVGNSGGALVNASGKLIGLNVAYMSVSGAYEGFSFAIPGNMVKKIADDLRSHSVSQKASLGINIRQVNKDDAAAAQQTTRDGVVIDAVIAGSSADQSGLQSLDIITSWNGTPVIGISDFKEKLVLSRPGDVVKYGVRRGTKDLVVEVKLE